MKDDLIALKMVLDRMGLQLTLSDFDNRLLLQKAVYLLQLARIDLGYRYSWYIRGPYCSELTKDLFDLYTDQKNIGELAEDYTLSKDVEPLLEKAKNLLKKPADIELSDAHWYELLASLHYLKHIAYIPNIAEKNFETVYDAFDVKKKGLFPSAIALKAWKFLEANSLLKYKELPLN